MHRTMILFHSQFSRMKVSSTVFFFVVVVVIVVDISSETDLWKIEKKNNVNISLTCSDLEESRDLM